MNKKPQGGATDKLFNSVFLSVGGVPLRSLRILFSKLLDACDLISSSNKLLLLFSFFCCLSCTFIHLNITKVVKRLVYR